MKLLPKLIEKLEKATSTEEKKQVFLDAGIELDDKEIEIVSGGILDSDPSDNVSTLDRGSSDDNNSQTPFKDRRL